MSRVYGFDHLHDRPARELADLLGGKGAGLAEMTTALGLPVPPGFTVTMPVCREYLSAGWPADLDAELDEHLDRLAGVMGRRLGDAADPLLLAVRSGAPISMPGMLDTVLNLGLNEETVRGLAAVSGDEWFARDSHRRFLTMFATTVMGVPETALPRAHDLPDVEDLARHVDRLQERIAELAGRPVPDDPREQLQQAVEAVFRSWNAPRAQAYREREGIDATVGTAVNVQAMVFGNRGSASGTGVVFTRDPATGAPGPYGDYLPRAQGEDVVAGTATTLPVAQLAEHHPPAYAELLGALRMLEVHYRDVCDVEFTLEEGRLWLLQTRIGKRGAVAAVRIAVDLVADPDVSLTVREALDRVPAAVRAKARAEVLERAVRQDAAAPLLVSGLGASPGRACGRVVLTAEEAADAEDDVVLVRQETSPEDVAGMAASVGVLTTRGGLVSHAAVVARGWGIPAVVGADQLVIDGSVLRAAGGQVVRAGEVITIDGTTGCVWLGRVEAATAVEADVHRQLPQLTRLEEWATSEEVTA